jgi:hypothetical protein
MLLTARASNGTNQLAELLAVVITVQYLNSKQAYKKTNGCKVLFITDNSLVENTLKQISEDPVKLYQDAAHCDIAAGLLAFARRGFRFFVHRIGRNTTPVHAGVDEASRAARLNSNPEAAYAAALEKSFRNHGKKESSIKPRTTHIKRKRTEAGGASDDSH